MKHIKKFNESWLGNIFKSDKDKKREEMFKTQDLSKDPLSSEGEFTTSYFIVEPLSEPSQFGQLKFMIYIQTPKSTYYIGDLRKFKDDKEYTSYLNIPKYVEKSPKGETYRAYSNQAKIIDQELDSDYLSSNLMDDTITHREFLNKNGISI